MQPALFGGLARLVSGNVPPTAPQRISSQEEAGSAPLPPSSLPCEPEALLPAIIVLEDLEAIAAHREYNLPSTHSWLQTTTIPNSPHPPCSPPGAVGFGGFCTLCVLKGVRRARCPSEGQSCTTSLSSFLFFHI